MTPVLTVPTVRIPPGLGPGTALAEGAEAGTGTGVQDTANRATMPIASNCSN